MPTPRCSPDQPLAILSFHSHSDRSFLDDRELATLSGALRHEGIGNDLILTVLANEGEDETTESKLAETLASYDPIVYERVWSPEVIVRLRKRLPGKTFIGLRGEHELLDDAPADVFCNGEPKQLLGPLCEWLRGRRDLPPRGILLRDQAQQWQAAAADQEIAAREFPYGPNLRPIVVNPELLPDNRTFSVTGNEGCPYQQDARENPLYQNTEIPKQFGRGCAFCTTGNSYEGKPNEVTAESVFEQIAYVRTEAPDLTVLVLKDQNPFGYLTEVIERCRDESVSGYTLLLETRAEWFLRNAGRFARALEVARKIGVRLAPFLVGIENFSQDELNRFNKGITAETNIEFLDTLWRWKEEYGDALALEHAAFGFILFSPWTTMEDLEANLAGVKRTNFDRLRGSILHARARLYPDTALYYLAQRDGLLVENFASEADDASKRYGYYPSHPWRHQHADVAHFAAIATELTTRNQSRDMVRLFETILTCFRESKESWSTLTADSVWQRYRRSASPVTSSGKELQAADEALSRRFAKLVHPLSPDSEFAGGWRLGPLRTAPGRVVVELLAGNGDSVTVELVPRGQGAYFRRSKHYHIRSIGQPSNTDQVNALRALAEAIIVNDS